MKKRLSVITVSFFLLLLFSSFRPVADPAIKVIITNLRNNSGHLLISLFKDGSGYPDRPEKAFRKERIAINNKTAILNFKGVPSGNYAVAFLHDENDDQKMNTNFFGIPKEGYGFSNNVMGTFGPPSYSKASFNFINNTITSVTIKARY